MYHRSMCVCVALCVEPVLEVEGERDEKEEKKRKIKIYLNKMGKKNFGMLGVL